MLYRDRTPLGKYQGFYGKLMEASADGAVDFIGNTEFGSTVFRMRGPDIERLLESDRVIDARRVNPNAQIGEEVAGDDLAVTALDRAADVELGIRRIGLGRCRAGKVDKFLVCH